VGQQPKRRGADHAREEYDTEEDEKSAGLVARDDNGRDGVPNQSSDIYVL
jgi:hypothetical protein